MLNKLKITLFTLCVLSMFLGADAAQNRILSTGVRKVSDNTVNFTFYTSGDSLEKPIVKSKGNNEYTILLPNLTDSTSRSINIGATEGIVTSADVKTINEGAVSYTKINVKTSKPVTINAETRQTTQTSNDISNLNSIVSKVNLINQDVKNSANVANVQAASAPKTQSVQQAAMKASSVKDIIRQNSALAPKRSAIQEAVAVNTVSAHTPKLKKSEKTEISKQKTENIKNIKPISNISKAASPEIQKQEPPKSEPVNDVAVMNTAMLDDDVATVSNDIQESSVAEEQITVENQGFSLFESIKNILLSPITTIILLICALLAIFGLLFKKLTSNLSVSQSINDSFVEKLNNILNKPKQKDFSGIVNNESMSWQEKYRAFNESNNKPETTKPKKIDGNYVIEISNDKTDEKSVQADKAEKKRIFKSIESGTDNTISQSKSAKSYHLKSFNNQIGSKQAMREKLYKMTDDEVSSTEQTAVTNTVKSSHLENMRIMLNRSIDSDREFYIVSENGKYSLLGRVKNRLVILKHFGQNAPYDLQIMRGQGSSFIVKAGNYKAQVNVSDSDMNIYSKL